MMMTIQNLLMIFMMMMMIYSMINYKIHPLNMMIILILFTITSTMYMYMTMKKSMYMYMIFISMISGMMIMFMYFTSLISNLKSNPMKTMLTMMALYLVTSSIMMIKFNTPMQMSPHKYTLTMIYLNPYYLISMLTIINLIYCLILVFKMSIKFNMPLRKLKNYDNN